MTCSRCHQEVHVPFSLPHTVTDSTPSSYLSTTVNCQATEDNWWWSQTHRPRVSMLKRTVASTPPSMLSPQTTSVNTSTTNGSPPSVVDVHASRCGGNNSNDDEHADNDSTPKRPQMTQVWPAFTALRPDRDQGECHGLNAQRGGENNGIEHNIRALVSHKTQVHPLLMPLFFC